MFSDSVLCVGVFSAALTIYFQPTYVILDPICTFIFSLLVLCTTITILKAVIWILVNTLNKANLSFDPGPGKNLIHIHKTDSRTRWEY